VKPVFKGPNDAVPKLQAEFLENWIEPCIQREDFAVLNIVSNLPAK
jgi:hypothetical protein